MKIWKGNYGWQCMATGKTKDGEELKKYIDVRFTKKSGTPIGNEATIKLLDWFPSLFKRRDGSIDVQFVVMGYQEVFDDTIPDYPTPTQKAVEEFKQDNLENTQSIHIEESELPFY